MKKSIISLILILAMLLSSISSFAAPTAPNVNTVKEVPENLLFNQVTERGKVKIRSLVTPQSLTVNIGEKIQMPGTVTANMSDGSTKEVSVNWYPKQLYSNRSGVQIAIGTVKGFNWIVTFTVIVEQSLNLQQPVLKLDKGIELVLAAPEGISYTIISEQGVVIVEDGINFPSELYKNVGQGKYILIYQGLAPGYFVEPSKSALYSQIPIEGKLNEFELEIYRPVISGRTIYLNGTIKFDSKLIKIDKTLLEEVKLEAASKNESDYTVESFGKLTSALELPEETQAEVDAKVLSINIAIEELKEKVKIISLVNPETITLKVRDQIVMPETVTANMSDGTTKEVSVTWEPKQIPNNRSGEITAIGTVEEFEGTVSFTVILEHTVVLFQPDFKLDKGIELAKAAPDGVSYTIIRYDGIVIAENETKFPGEFYQKIAHGEYTLIYNGFAPGYYVYPHAVVPSKYTQTPIEGKLNEFLVEIIKPTASGVYVYLNGMIKFDGTLIPIDKEALAEEAVLAAENSKNQTDVDIARLLVLELPEGNVKDGLLARLLLVQGNIDQDKIIAEATRLLDEAELATTVADANRLINLAYKEIKKLPAGDTKIGLTNRMNHIVDKVVIIVMLESYINVDLPINIRISKTAKAAQSLIDDAQSRLDSISGAYDKTILQGLINDQQLIVDSMLEAEELTIAIKAAENAIAALPILEDIRIEDKQAVLDARALFEAVKIINPEAIVIGEGLIGPLLEKIIYLESEASNTNYRLDIWMNDPENLDALRVSEVLFEGYITNVKYLERVLVDNEEANVIFVENAEIKDPTGKIVYTGPAYKFNLTLNLEDDYHQISVSAISQSGKTSNIIRRFYTDTTPPELKITPVGLNPNNETTLENVELTINVKDNFGEIVLYDNYDSWYKEFGSIYNKPVDETITYNLNLQMGENKIVFRLQDSVGWWSEDVEVTITRIAPVPIKKGNVQISLMKDISDKVNFELIKDSFYIENKLTGEKFSEGNYLSSSRKDIYQIKNVPVGEYTIHYNLPEQLSTKKLQLGGAYKETNYDAEINPLKVEDLGSKNYNYVKIIIKANILIKEINDMEDLVLPKNITYEEFWAIKPTTAIIVDENNIEHIVEIKLSVNKFNFEAGRDKGFLRIESDSFELPLYVSNTEPAMRLRTNINITFEDITIIPIIVSLANPEPLTVEIREMVNMPVTVTATMSDGTIKEVSVTWNPESIDTSTSGSKLAIGMVEGFDGSVTFTVIVKEEILETIQEKLILLKNDLKDNLLYGEPSYNIEAKNKISDKLIELGLDPKEFKITVDPFEANGNKRVQIFHNKSEAAIGFYFIKAKPLPIILSLVDPNPLTVEFNQTVVMPATVIAKYSDGTVKDLPVSWNPTQIDTSFAGTKEALGKVEGFEGDVTFIVIVEEEIIVEEIQQKLVELKNDLKDYPLTGVPSYNTEARNIVRDKLIQLGLESTEFKITVDPFDANGNKRVQIFHDKSKAAIGFYFKKSNLKLLSDLEVIENIELIEHLTFD